jgi:hypothetical protein
MQSLPGMEEVPSIISDQGCGGGVPDPKVGAIIKAVVLQAGQANFEEDISLPGKPGHQGPKIIEFRGELPRLTWQSIPRTPKEAEADMAGLA